MNSGMDSAGKTVELDEVLVWLAWAVSAVLVFMAAVVGLIWDSSDSRPRVVAIISMMLALWIAAIAACLTIRLMCDRRDRRQRRFFLDVLRVAGVELDAGRIRSIR